MALEWEVGQRVSEALALKLPRRQPRPAPEPRFREAYLKGRYHLNKNTAEAAKRSLPFFAQAVAQDPLYAPAHAGLAHAYLALPWEPSRIALARDAVQRALELDGRLAEAHSLRGELALQVDWRWDIAEEAFLRAIELDPAALAPRTYYAYWLSIQGRHQEAIAQIQRTISLDPVLSLSGRGHCRCAA